MPTTSSTIELEGRYPTIPWRVPVLVRWPGGSKYACRFCIAQIGLKHDSEHQWPTATEVVEHIRRAHR